MSQQKDRSVFQTLCKPPPSRTEDQLSQVAEWMARFELLELFVGQPELPRIINLLEGVKLKRNEHLLHQEGVEFCYVISGLASLDGETQSFQQARRKGRVQGMGPGEWIIRHLPLKECTIVGKDQDNDLIVLSSKCSRKLINKKLTMKWGQYARIIANQPLFKYLDKDTLLNISQTAKIKTLPYNSVIYDQGDQALESYILLEGNIRLLSDGIQVTCLSPEQVFGDQQILSAKPRRQYKAVVASEKVKLMRIERSKVQKALTVLTVLGKEKSVEKYVSSKNNYRSTITKKMKWLLMDKEKEAENRKRSIQFLPLYKQKRQSLDSHDFEMQNNPQHRIIPARLMQVLKLTQPTTVIRSRDLDNKSPRKILPTKRDQGSKVKRRQQTILPFLKRV